MSVDGGELPGAVVVSWGRGGLRNIFCSVANTPQATPSI